MPKSIVTDWKRVAQSGPTIDNRFIKPEWLTEMAETYDPAVYTAKLWVDHFRFRGAYGSVSELKAEKDGDVVRLFAKINPNLNLIEMNQIWEEKLHFSIEPVEDFAGTGKTYLGGLGITDEPASLGTDELRFSSTKDRMFTACYPGDEVPDLRIDYDEFSKQETEKYEPGFLGKFFRAFFQMNETETKQGEESMDKAQADKLFASIETLTNGITAMQTALEKFTAAKPGDGDVPPDQPDENGAGTGEFSQQAFNEKFEEIKKDFGAQVEELTKRFSELTERLEKAVPGTRFTETTAPAEGADDLL